MPVRTETADSAMTLRFGLTSVASPIGDVLLVTDQDGCLRALDFHDHADRLHRLLRLHYGAVVLRDHGAPAAVTLALGRYFAGDLAAPEAVPVATAGTPFQRSVWAALRALPAGRTETYAGLAARIGRPAACRAVGAANAANPVAIVVPCHRVIGANAALTGFGGGLHRKAWLLAHEANHAALA